MSIHSVPYSSPDSAHESLGSNFISYFVMVQKELLELSRSFKLLWVPLVFILLGIMQPVSTYYMPIILEKAGSLPEGTVIQIPNPAAAEVLAQTLQQFGTLGVLILVLVSMGAVSDERSRGILSLILVKPVSHLSYIASKWTSMLILSWGSLAVGYGAAWYYSNLLFGPVKLVPVLESLLIYGLWLSFVVTVTILFSTLLRSSAAAAFAALVSAVLLSLLTGLFPQGFGWSPGALSGLAYEAVASIPTDSSKLYMAIVATCILIGVAVWGAAYVLNRSSTLE